ncbi:MAG: sigma-54-dependent Fis family transcriptional regulator [Lentisphaerae bacterium GWF2_52_8]|nr:MAG: sigma-54-dependent Fis family transcriptional regulator [Lentisphaerae bacterium GWF2_52_8]
MSTQSSNGMGIDMTVLHQISHVLVHQRHNISSLLREVLDILHREMGLLRGTFSLCHGNMLIIEASHGLTEKEIARGRYKIGEGVTGKVAKTGKPRVIPDVSKEPEFLDRTKTRSGAQNLAFICVPIINKDKVIGTLSIDCQVSPDLNKELPLLETVANILADAVAMIRDEAEEREQLLAENKRLRLELDQQFHPSNIVGNCSSMRAVYSMIAQVAESSATVLIRGESGTGKELVARAIHYASQRRNKPFIAVNCAALPENLIESELFGHEKGAFTGAISQRKGRFELANGGTLFLDEIGDISLAVQVRLLRFLQEKTFERVGGHEPINVDVRVLAATSRNLEEEIEKDHYREDLFYRLNVFPIHMPSLHQRRADIMLLADHFLEKYNKIYNKNVKRISTPAINMMMSYHWPGNVRELENCIERAVLTATDDVVHGFNLPPSLQTAQETGTALLPKEGASLTTLVASYERELIVDALKINRGNVAAAARALDATQRILHYKIDRLKIDPKKYH